MQAGNLVSSDVQAYTSRVLVNGVERPATSWSVDRELSGDLPAQVVAVSGMTQATGSIYWSTAEDVTEHGRNPWNSSTGWLPRKGDRVEIYAGDGTTEWKQFHGVIDTTTGSVGEGFQSSLIDDYDKLSTEVAHDPLLRIMPPSSLSGPYRGIGLNASYFANMAMRASGFYSTPKLEAYPALSVPCQGSMWAEAGLMTAGASFDGVGSHATLNIESWGWSVGNFENKYSPAISRPASDPIQISMLVSAQNAGFAYVRAVFGTSYLQLSVNNSKLVTANVNGVGVLSFTLASDGVVQVLVKGDVVTLRSSNGQTVSTTAAFARATVMGEIIVSGTEGTRVAGIQVSHPAVSTQEFAAVGHTMSARLDFTDTTLSGIMDASRTIEPTSASSLLDEIGSATLSAMWIDELGVLQWVSSSTLVNRLPVRTVTSLDDIFSLDWEDSLLGARSKVTVTGFNPAITSGQTLSRTVWRGDGDDLGSQEVSEVFIEPDADTEWIQVDSSPTRLGSGNWSDYNLRSGSYFGVFYTASGETTSDTGLSTSIAMARLGPRKFLIRHVAGTFPADVTAVMGTSPTDTSLWPRNRDVALPLIRAYAISKWPEVRVTPVAPGGIGPELVHDAGQWTNESVGTERLDRLATFISGQTSVPKPTVTGVGIIPDPRLQLGDVITISSPDLMGITMDALIVGVSSTFGASYEQSLTVRIIDVNSSFTTYAEYDKAINGNLSYAQWQALGPVPQSYAEFNNE